MCVLLNLKFKKYLSIDGSIRWKDVFDLSGLGEQLCHGPGHGPDVSLGLLEGVELVGQVFAELDLQIKAAQGAIEPKNIAKNVLLQN